MLSLCTVGVGAERLCYVYVLFLRGDDQPRSQSGFQCVIAFRDLRAKVCSSYRTSLDLINICHNPGDKRGPALTLVLIVSGLSVCIALCLSDQCQVTSDRDFVVC